MDISTILAGISTVEKLVPVIEAVGKEIGPLVEKEVADGKVIWSDLVAAFEDFKATVAVIKAAAQPATK